MTIGERQLKEWRGDFGDAYIDRNQATPAAIAGRALGLAAILDHLRGDPPATIFEGGTNIGLNLRALGQLTTAKLFGVEPNRKARERLVSDGIVPEDHVRDGTLSHIPFADASMDLVFTSGVLIHVPDDALDASYRELHRISRRYILSIEYFSAVPMAVPYRGQDDLLFKRDYGSLWLDGFPDLEWVADGFFWKRSTGLDNLNWWLFRKR